MNNRPNSKRSVIPWRVHPIWRGIGCLFLIIVPIVSLGLADLLIERIDDPLPEILTRPLTLPGIGMIDNFYARILTVTIISIGLFLLLSILGSILYSALGGSEQEKRAEMIKRDPFKH